MNIFFLSANPYQAAKYHCDKHVVKMILETAQMLSTVCHLRNIYTEGLYKPTHKNHPSTIWVGTSFANYTWTMKLLDGLLVEYSYRYGKKHKTLNVYRRIFDTSWKLSFPETYDGYPLCMPEQYKSGVDNTNLERVVDAYRNYYINEKAYFATWKRREKPYWFDKT